MDTETGFPENPESQGYRLSGLVIPLLKGVVYQEADPAVWNDLMNFQARVRDYIAVLGLELVLDEAEGFAFLRSRSDSDGEGQLSVPRLIARRPLSYNVSLVLALLRRKLAEFDAVGGETQLVIGRDEIVDLVRLFLPDSTNETRLFDQIDSTINKIVDLGFLRRLKTNDGSRGGMFEVRRILKAFIDAQWLSDFDTRLSAYLSQTPSEDPEAGNE